MRRFGQFLTLAVLVAPVSASAWLARGHEQIADIAWSRLSDRTKAEIGQILASGDSEFVPADSTEASIRAAFRKASTWADWIKEHKEGQFERDIEAWNAMFQPGYSPQDTNREAHRCKRWHYFDVPIHVKEGEPGVEGSNALVAMTTARYEFAILGRQSPSDRRTQCWWLYWLTHVIGDLHQPLHCVSSYEHEPHGDAGGNLFKLGITFPNSDRKANLHFLWDQGIENAIAMEAGQSADPEAVTARWVAAHSPQPASVDSIKFADWIAEGAKLARDTVYAGIDRDGQPTPGYLTQQAEVCRRQAVLAGFRLAREIEAGLGTSG